MSAARAVVAAAGGSDAGGEGADEGGEGGAAAWAAEGVSGGPGGGGRAGAGAGAGVRRPGSGCAAQAAITRAISAGREESGQGVGPRGIDPGLSRV